MSMAVPSSVCVVGVGGLGCAASLAVASAGVERLVLVDPDVVEPSNLHRQLLHGEADLGRAKVESAAEKLRLRYPALRVETRREAAGPSTVAALLAGCDVTLDATDGVKTKFMLADAAAAAGATLVYAGVLRFDGLAMRLERGGPCLRCLFETMPADGLTCAQAGVLGAMAVTMGALQGLLALAPNANAGESTLHVVDGATLTTRALTVKRRPDCATCGALP
ncbi:MAG: ThiF family adenylyltransferase [Archangium sp.]|nr:ThiF family adenylyltransferase [Archangium sp.]